MGFKTFVAIYLAIVIGVSSFIVVAMQKPKQNTEVSTSNHFSVVWMGFAPPDYSSEYPEYYICINNLKDDPLRMQIALQIKNQESSPFYFKIDKYGSPPSGWTILPGIVGKVDVDETKQFVFDNIFRSRPASIPEGRLTESITLVVQAYYDPYYTNLYSEDYFSITFNFLDYTSSQWAILYHDDFDDGQKQGWSVIYEGWGKFSDHYGASISTTDLYYRSFQFSLQLYTWAKFFTDISGWYYSWARAAYTKSFNIGAVSEAYLIFSLRSENWDAHMLYGIKINGVTYYKCDVTPSPNVWYQFAIKLKPCEVNTVQIWVAGAYSSPTKPQVNIYSYLDDVYVIAR